MVFGGKTYKWLQLNDYVMISDKVSVWLCFSRNDGQSSEHAHAHASRSDLQLLEGSVLKGDGRRPRTKPNRF